MEDSSLTDGHRKRLRDRFERSGFAGFNDHEVLELLLTLAIPRKDVKVPAKQLLKKFGSLRAVLDADASELRSVEGIGTVAPVALRIVRESAQLYLQEQVEGSTDRTDLTRVWQLRLEPLRNEVFEVAYLDPAGRLLRNGIERLEEGTVDRAAVYPRTVMASALRRNCTGLMLAHNHTNGVPTPSEQDKVLTRALVLAAETLGLRIYDHLIIGRSKVFSFAAEGLL
jgi:DNA repair protein RadC